MLCVFFDLDGTLTDPQKGITRCIQYALQRLGVNPPPLPQLVRYIGPPLHESLAELLGYPDEETVMDALRFYRKRFESQGIYENRLYPDVIDLLKRVLDKGWRAYVVTTKPTPYAQQIINHFSLDGFFSKVFGSCFNGTLSRKNDLIRYVLKEESIAPVDAAMVGDRLHDVRGALANGVAAIGVAYGYGSREELQEAGARWICDTPLMVFDALVAYFHSQGYHSRGRSRAHG
jgi:phosphoglycolate phosphatase